MKVLHIGNIANNGYNVANLLNKNGIETHVLVGPYYHVAGCPEWEEAEFVGDLGDDFYPNWRNVTITNGYSRPKWVAQGPYDIAIKYLIEYNKGNARSTRYLWRLLKLSQWSVTNGWACNYTALISVFASVSTVKNRALARLKYYTKYYAANIIHYGLLPVRVFVRFFRRFDWFDRYFRKLKIKYKRHKKQTRLRRSIDAALFDETDDSESDSPLSTAEVIPYLILADLFTELFENYDVVVGFSTDGIWPLLCGKKYIAYEHGTIRTIPFQEDTQGRLCKWVYQSAEAVIITNCDNNVAAEKLKLQNYYYTPHYINEMPVPKSGGENIRAELVKKYGTDFIVYNPSRQHWTERRDGGWEKGNDVFIRAFAEFVRHVNPRALAVFTNWGQSVEQSKILLSKLDISSNIHWVDPVPHKKMIELIHASDLVSDQFLIGTFGGIPAKALQHGKPVITAFDKKMHEWCFEAMPPFLPAGSEEEIYDSLTRAYSDKSYYSKMQNLSVQWYKMEHSNEILFEKIARIMADISQ